MSRADEPEGREGGTPCSQWVLGIDLRAIRGLLRRAGPTVLPEGDLDGFTGFAGGGGSGVYEALVALFSDVEEFDCGLWKCHDEFSI